MSVSRIDVAVPQSSPGRLLRAGAAVAAAIVEAHAYAFLYRAVAAGGRAGSNAILRLGLPPEGLGVMGAAMLPTSAQGGSTLLVLTENAVHTFKWR